MNLMGWSVDMAYKFILFFIFRESSSLYVEGS
jgi:hypothetical protein